MEFVEDPEVEKVKEENQEEEGDAMIAPKPLDAEDKALILGSALFFAQEFFTPASGEQIGI